MPGLAIREVECFLCQKPFRLLTIDFIVPWTLICDECLVEMWEMEGDALAEYLTAARPAEPSAQPRDPTASPAQPHPLEREIIAHLEDLKQYATTAQEAILARQNPFSAAEPPIGH